MQLPEEKQIRVFLVDDHKTVLWGLQQLVESAAPLMAVVGMATNCAELFAKLPETQPDVILLDLDLNGESSLDSLEQLTQQSPAQVLILTASNDPAVHQQAVVRGARGVVHKQVSADLLLQAIKKVHHGEIWLDHTTLVGVISTLTKGQRTDPESARIAELTPKERQIIATIVQEKGAPNKLIADKLYMSEHTLRNHLTSIYSKLGVEGRMELYVYATMHPKFFTAK